MAPVGQSCELYVQNPVYLHLSVIGWVCYGAVKGEVDWGAGCQLLTCFCLCSRPILCETSKVIIANIQSDIVAPLMYSITKQFITTGRDFGSLDGSG